MEKLRNTAFHNMMTNIYQLAQYVCSYLGSRQSISLIPFLVMVAQEMSSLYQPRHWTSACSKMTEQV